MWRFNSPIGSLYIKRLPDSRYGLIYNGIIWESSATPHDEADNVFMQCTGCSEWDLFDATSVYVPHDLSEWEQI